MPICRWKAGLFALALLFAQATVNAQTPETATAEYRELPREYILDGVVEAIHQATVSSQTSGRVEEILFDVDDFVEQGKLIIRLRDSEQKARLAKAEADLKEARARLDEAQEAWERTKQIYQRKLVAKSQMDQADAALKAAKARREAAEAGLRQAKEQLDYTQIRAPYSGIVTKRHVELGETAQSGQPLMSGISLHELRVSVNVPQSLIKGIRESSQARVFLNTRTDDSVAAAKITIFPIADSGPNTFKVRLDLPPGTADFFPGMFVKAGFTVGTQRQLLVPTSSVVYRSEVTGVYVMGADGQLTLRQIRIGHATADGMLEVLSGLEEGEQVALDPVAAGVALKAQQGSRK
jgi:RND family efflux transporter MFP subunit